MRLILASTPVYTEQHRRDPRGCTCPPELAVDQRFRRVKIVGLALNDEAVPDLCEDYIRIQRQQQTHLDETEGMEFQTVEVDADSLRPVTNLEPVQRD